MKETKLTNCGECQKDFRPGEIVWFSWMENRCFCSPCQSKLPFGQWEPQLVPEKDGLVGRVVDLANELHEFAQEKRFTFIIDGHGEPSVQMLTECFFKTFNTFDINETTDQKYPYQVLNDVEGVVFSALITSDEHRKYVHKEKVGE